MKLKTNHVLIIAGIIVILFFYFSIQRSCKLYDENSMLKGQYETLKQQKSEADKLSVTIIEAQEKAIKQLDEAIKKSDDIVNEKAQEIKNKDSKISSLEKAYAQLSQSGDKDKQIKNLQEQVMTWAEKFGLAEMTIKEKDKIIFSLTEKFNAQVKISDEYLLQIGREINLRNVAEERIAGLEKSLKGLRFTGKIKNYLVIATGGYIVYLLIKK